MNRIITRYLDNPNWLNTQLLGLSHTWDDVKNFFLRIWYCHHNARVIADFEERMTAIIYEVTGTMSKPYYTIPAMMAEIESQKQVDYAYAYNDAIDDAKATLDGFMQGDHPQSMIEALEELKADTDRR